MNNELELLRKEVRELRATVEALLERERARDRDIREGYLMIVRGAEKRLGMGKYAEDREPARAEA